MSRVIRSFYHGAFSRVGEELRLASTESHHLANVLRRSDGDSIELLNGRGARAEAKCCILHEKDFGFRITKILQEEKKEPQIRMVLSITKGGKWEEQIKPLTELGVSRITPIFTDHTESKERRVCFDKKLEKWKKLAIEACKQSGNPWLPQIDQPLFFDKYLEACSGNIWVAGLAKDLNCLQMKASAKEVNILIGPEGGWSEREEKVLQTRDAKFFTLGRYTLRAETASLCALAVARSQFLG